MRAGRTGGAGPRVGVVGGGQLARMMAPAAVRLGVHLRVLAETPDAPAAQVIPDATVGDYTDLATLRRFAADCDVVTFDHEHVPTRHLEALEAAGVAVRPGPAALVHAQDKIAMRQRLVATGLPVPAHVVAVEAAEVQEFATAVGWPVVLKVPRGGYDGKGVWAVRDEAELVETLAAIPTRPLLVEQHVDFACEIAAVVARSPIGQAVAYPVVQTVQHRGICREVIAPAPTLTSGQAVRAQEIALSIADELGVAGVLAVEMFATTAGELLVNELAMRPHNSGHWTIDGAVTDQFEQHLRAVLDLPLGDPRSFVACTVMVNILGGTRDDLSTGFNHVMARDPGLRVHVYGKAVRPGRKIGHVTVSGRDPGELLGRARHAADFLATANDEPDSTGEE